MGDESAWVGSRGVWEWVNDPTQERTTTEVLFCVVRQGDLVSVVAVQSLDPVSAADRTLLQDLAETTVDRLPD